MCGCLHIKLRSVLLQGEEARNIPGETVSEEQFIDEDGNIITRKVTLLFYVCFFITLILHQKHFITAALLFLSF